MFQNDTCMQPLSLSLTHTHTHTHTHVKAWVSMEKDFVNVNAIQWWQQAMSAVKWALCWAECNDSQDNWSRIWNGFHFVVTCWGRLTGWLAREGASESPSRGCPLPLSLSPSYTPLEIHFHSSIFIYASAPVQCSGILALSEPEREVRLYFSCYTCIFSIWHLSARDSGPPRQSSTM